MWLSLESSEAQDLLLRWARIHRILWPPPLPPNSPYSASFSGNSLFFHSHLIKLQNSFPGDTVKCYHLRFPTPSNSYLTFLVKSHAHLSQGHLVSWFGNARVWFDGRYWNLLDRFICFTFHCMCVCVSLLILRTIWKILLRLMVWQVWLRRMKQSQIDCQLC